MTWTQNILQSNNLNQNTILTISDISQALKIEKSSVRRWISEGLLTGKRFGSRIFVQKDDFEKFLDLRFKDIVKDKEND